MILGLGGSPLWSAKCTYLTISGNAQAAKDGGRGPDVINQYFGIFFFIFQSSAVWGNLMSSLIFGQDMNIGGGGRGTWCHPGSTHLVKEPVFHLDSRKQMNMFFH